MKCEEDKDASTVIYSLWYKYMVIIMYNVIIIAPISPHFIHRCCVFITTLNAQVINSTLNTRAGVELVKLGLNYNI